MPGGAIEFGETPEDTLKRELLEEVALAAGQLEFLSPVTATVEYKDQGEICGFHQVGLIYRVLDWVIKSEIVPQEESRWVLPNATSFEELTPFARYAISYLLQ